MRICTFASFTIVYGDWDYLLILCLKLRLCEMIQNICWLSGLELMNHILEHSHTLCTHPGEHLLAQKFFKAQGAWMDSWIMLNFWIPFDK